MQENRVSEMMRKRRACHNRRQAPRFDVEFKAEAYRASLQEARTVFEVTVQDLSAQGARLISKTRIPAGESLIVTISGVMQFRAKVARVKENHTTFELGVLMEVGRSASRERPETESANPIPLRQSKKINHQAFEKDKRLNKVLRFVEDHYDERIPLKEAARVAAMEATYFSTFFRQKVGINYLDWIHHLRVAKAISLLEDENLSITDVAFQVGFNDLRTFQRVFKKHTLATPSALRKQLLTAS